MNEVLRLQERKMRDMSGDWAWFKEFAGITMVCNYYTLHLMSTIISQNPQLRGILEFGTYTGSMALYLGIEGLRAGIPVTTIDIKEQLEPPTKRLLEHLQVKTLVGDIFAADEQALIKKMLSRFPVYLVVDNGDKPREFKEFVPMLCPGSIVSVHDYGMEFFDKDWEFLKEKVEPYMQEEWTNHNVQLAHFRVK